MTDSPDWFEITRRNARSVQTTIGWIFWDPGATRRYVELGLPEPFAEPLGYIAARCAPLAGAGPDAVIAAFGSISAFGIRALFDVLDHDVARFEACRQARDEAVTEGLRTYAPAIVVAAGLTHTEASILHNSYMDYDADWMSTSRGATPEEIEDGWSSLVAKGLATITSDTRRVLPEGRALRQQIEDDTDRLTTLPWELLGEQRSRSFASAFEPPCEALLARVDETAGPNYQPASRLRS